MTFPTPPRSRHRATSLSWPTHFGFDPLASIGDSASCLEPDRSPHPKPLPRSLETLLKLHHAFNICLSLHFATHPPVLPPHSPSSTRLELTSLTNFLAIKGTVERTAGRRFGLPELGRLAWLWTWDGKSLPPDQLTSVAKQNEGREGAHATENPFLVSSKTEANDDKVSGLTYLITPTRTLDPASGRRVQTYGLGIELELVPGETRNLPLAGSSSTRGQGGGAGAISRWNGAGEQRDMEIRRKLERWVSMHGGYEVSRPVPRYWFLQLMIVQAGDRGEYPAASYSANERVPSELSPSDTFTASPKTRAFAF